MLQYPIVPAASYLPTWLRAALLQLLIIFFLLCLAILPQPLLSSVQSQVSELELPELLQAQRLALTPFEQGFFANYSDNAYSTTSTQKFRFEFAGISGSILLVASPSWRSQHAPELCYSANGYHLDQSIAQSLSPEILGRWLSLDNHTHSAVYWFQSTHRTTGDFLIRLWHEVSDHDLKWVLVSILLDQFHRPDEPIVQALLDSVYHALEQHLEID